MSAERGWAPMTDDSGTRHRRRLVTVYSPSAVWPVTASPSGGLFAV